MASVDTLLILNMLVFATLIMHQLGLAAGSNQVIFTFIRYFPQK